MPRHGEGFVDVVTGAWISDDDLWLSGIDPSSVEDFRRGKPILKVKPVEVPVKLWVPKKAPPEQADASEQASSPEQAKAIPEQAGLLPEQAEPPEQAGRHILTAEERLKGSQAGVAAGGRQRASVLSKVERSEIARKGAQAMHALRNARKAQNAS